MITQLVESTENQAVSALLCPVLSLYLLLRLKTVGQSTDGLSTPTKNMIMAFFLIDLFFLGVSFTDMI